MKALKDVNVTITTKAGVVAGGVILLVLAGLIGWSYKEMSSLRRDLYGIRGDYYSADSDDSRQVEYKLLSQGVQRLRVQDLNADLVCGDDKYDCEYPYETQNVRVVEIHVKNNQDYLFSYYDGSLSAVGENGKLSPTVTVHPDDNRNDWAASYGSLDLVPGGEATIYVYLTDTGQDVTSLYSTEFSQEIKLD